MQFFTRYGSAARDGVRTKRITPSHIFALRVTRTVNQVGINDIRLKDHTAIGKLLALQLPDESNLQGG